MLVFVLLILLWAATPAKAVEPIAPTPIVISEFQTGGLISGLENGQLEFIELYNQQATDQVVNDWRLEYLSSSHDGGINPTRVITTFEGSIKAHSYVLLSLSNYLNDADIYFDSTSSSGLLAKSGGHLRLVNSQGSVIDLVGWGSAKHPETKAIAELAPNFSSQRILDPADPNRLLDSGNNWADFKIPSTPTTPQGGGLYVIVQPPDPECKGIVVSEIMADPLGVDSEVGSEFIELYNPTNQTIALAGCTLKTSASSKTYSFKSDDKLLAKQYKAYLQKDTGLTLTNSGGEVLLASSTEELEYSYPKLGDNQAYILLNGKWSLSDKATPSAANKLVVITEDETKEPCAKGKYRNPATGRCKNIQTVSSSLTPCNADQIRNPATNRCRKIITASATLTPCQAGYLRNSETNRCRKIANSSSLKPCAPGSTRNPETNRCRKSANATLATAADITKNGDDQAANTGSGSAQNLQWWALGAVGSAAGAYALYEWRFELGKGLAKIRGIFTK